MACLSTRALHGAIAESLAVWLPCPAALGDREATWTSGVYTALAYEGEGMPVERGLTLVRRRG